MNRYYMFLVWIGICLLYQTTALSAEIYRWKDGQGKTQYSTNPPARHVSGLVEVKRNNHWYPYAGEETLKSSGASKQDPINYTTSSPEGSQESPQITLDQTIVHYQEQNSVIIVDVLINHKLSRPFAVDTGATYTVISPEIAQALYLNVKSNAPQVTLQTANGRIQVPLVNLESVAVGELETPNVTAAVQDIDESSQISGLLGLNFLNRFQMTVDAAKYQLTLKPVQPLSKYKKRDCVTARTLLKRGRALNDTSEKEASYYKRAISLCPDLVEAYYYLGAVYINQQDAQRAVDLHREIIQMQPNEAEAHFRLGVAYILQRKFQKAEKELRWALRLNSDHQQAAEYLEHLKNQ